ncbi:hypothetical protein ACE41A_00095 [Bacillus cytotoxicus]|uniref:hypothetical protein n=1 Tax=Bacillus cytotoxicus TaxID=580165 RepID=UPI002ABC7774|nr:hypothetical protein [Bacillus cytotoxicus]
MKTTRIPDLNKAKERDEKAKKEGYIVAISGQVYTLTLSKTSCLYIDHIDGFWVAWRETHWNKQKSAPRTRLIAKAVTFDYLLMRVEGYLKFIEDMKSKGAYS